MVNISHKQKRNIIFTFFFVAILFFYFIFSSYFGKKEERIIFFDVGQGDMTLIQTKIGKNILIDAGKPAYRSRDLDQYFSISDRNIDLAIATHPDLDHIGGFLDIIENYKIKNFAYSQLLDGEPEYKRLAEKISQKNIPSSVLVAGDLIHIDENSYIEVLYPYEHFSAEKANEYSLVLRYVSGKQKVLLMGDALIKNEIEMYRFYEGYLKSNILKLGHHGSKTSSSLLFLDYVLPKISVVSTSCYNSFGHPHESVLEKVKSIGSKILDTCSSGDIVFIKKGENFIQK